MPSISYYNQTGPFWDFVANLEEQGSNHPFFNRRRSDEEGGEEGEVNGRWGPWAGHHRGFPFRGPPPHHQPPHPPHPPHHGPEGHPPPPPPPPAEGDHPMPPPPGEDGEPSSPPPFPGHDRHDRREHHRGRHGGCPGRRGGRGFGGRGDGGGGGGGWHGGRGGGPFGFGMGGGPGMPWGFAPFMQHLFNQGNNDNNNNNNNDETGENDFAPDADVFDTETTFVVHVSLPGAKKEDVGVNWDAEKSELSIAGVIYRPGDEDFLKTLAMDERKVGPFERKIRLGSRANPAQVDSDMITAKLEDGVLRIEVPKLDKDYVEIKKVDIL